MDDPISVLHVYGLDHVLTDQDDPCLWASALNKHWPRPDDSTLWDEDDNPFLVVMSTVRKKWKGRHIEVLLFGVGVKSNSKEARKGNDGSGMLIIERWYFERIDHKHLRAVQGDRETGYQFCPHYILDISRPSVKTTTALVHAGSHPAPLFGYGESRVWRHQADGSWTETDEVVSGWIS